MWSPVSKCDFILPSSFLAVACPAHFFFKSISVMWKTSECYQLLFSDGIAGIIQPCVVGSRQAESWICLVWVSFMRLEDQPPNQPRRPPSKPAYSWNWCSLKYRNPLAEMRNSHPQAASCLVRCQHSTVSLPRGLKRSRDSAWALVSPLCRRNSVNFWFGCIRQQCSLMGASSVLGILPYETPEQCSCIARSYYPS